MERLKPASSKNGNGLYFSKPSPDLEFFSSGCVLLDCVLGGGWVLGRMANIIGDKSTGKTLLAIEACANFARQYPKGYIWYREAEAAFDKGYAEALGMPIGRINPGEKKWRKYDTIEEIFEDLSEKIELANKKNQPALYILDSLDALSDKDEMLREMGEGSFNLTKQKKLGELFRKRVRGIEESRLCLIIISQVRAKIGVKFGEKTTRSGGAAMDFYASQAIKLSHVKSLKETINGVARVTGVRIRVKCVKNKIGLPQRECEFEIKFGYGVADYEAGMQWLIDVKRWQDLGVSKTEAADMAERASSWDQEEFTTHKGELDAVVVKAWSEIEQSFLPKRQKYG